jgi:hypothetical protein
MVTICFLFPCMEKYLRCILDTHEPPLGGELFTRQRLEVLAMNSLRTSMEWPYGDITILFQVKLTNCKNSNKRQR